MSVNPAIERLMSDARVEAQTPKPLLADMIEHVRKAAYDAESVQGRLLATGDRAEPQPEAIRHVVVLDACALFLEAIQTRPKEVGQRLLKQGAGHG